MKRDLDLLRQLLIDIENQGSDCAPSTLRDSLPGHEARPAGHAPEPDACIRYHLCLMIDAGLLKEIDQTVSGTPCVRLTHAGHELIELAQSDTLWQEAKWVVRELTGGESLAVLRALLTKWAAESATRGGRSPRRMPRSHSHYVEPRYTDPRYYEPRPARLDRRDFSNEELRLVRSRPDYLERFDWRNRTDRDQYARTLYARDTQFRDPYYSDYGREYPMTEEVGISLPIHVV